MRGDVIFFGDHIRRLQESERDQPMESSGDENLDNSGCDDGHNGHHRIPSDIDSQVGVVDYW